MVENETERITTRTKKVKRIGLERYKGWLILSPGSTFTFNEPYPFKHAEIRYDDFGYRAIKLTRPRR